MTNVIVIFVSHSFKVICIVALTFWNPVVSFDNIAHTFAMAFEGFSNHPISCKKIGFLNFFSNFNVELLHNTYLI